MLIAGTTTTLRPDNGKLAGVQVARGVAALMVVVYHTTRAISLPQYVGYVPFGNAFGFGHAGVDFFFVLSGFIITYAHAADVGRPDRTPRYLWRRVTRIYPIYWFVTGIEILRALFAPDAAARLEPMHLLNSVFLFPSSLDPLVGVAWTLKYEMLFYIVFALPILDRRLCKPLLAATLLLLLAGVVTEPANPFLHLLVSPFNIEFLMGIAAARWLATHRTGRPAAVAALGVVLFVGVGTLELHGIVPINGLTGRALYGGASVAILLGLVQLERQGTLRIGGVGLMFGDSSYCLYLIHLTVVTIAIRACAHFGLLAIVPGVAVAALVALALGTAVVLHIGVERPMARWLRRRTPRLCR
jgi:peptidoglycan/LPS O-acetylase OafA/YrhL